MELAIAPTSHRRDAVLITASVPVAVAQPSNSAAAETETVETQADGSEPAGDRRPQNQESVPVIVDGRVLFEIRESAGIGSLQERADKINQTIQAFARDRSRSVASLRIIEQQEAAWIIDGDLEDRQALVKVTAADAARTNVSVEELS